jgi:hypothetical protein
MNEELDKINEKLENTLNRHGYSFQYSVIKFADKLFSSRSSPWHSPLLEFPVEVQGYGTRIDVILKHREKPFFLLVETKRANPALSNWCFLKAPYPGNSLANRVVVERFYRDDPGRYTTLDTIDIAGEVCHLGIEVKSSQKGDPGGRGRGAIEGAATQVLRGLNGMIEFLSTNLQIINKYKCITLLPVIVTTADLYFSSADISNAELSSGEVDLSEKVLIKKEWLIYNYNQSPGLKHSVPSAKRHDKFDDILSEQFVRSIPIVNPTGLIKFLDSKRWYW